MAVQLIDAKAQRKELTRLYQELTAELFESCCQVQRDVDSVDLGQLSALVSDLKVLESRLTRLDTARLSPPAIKAGDSSNCV